MIYCECRRCEKNEEGGCKNVFLQINGYGRCEDISYGADSLEKLVSYVDLYFREYPFHLDKDRGFFREILDEFPELDVLEELRRFRIWLMDREDSIGKNYRSRFHNWLIRARERKEGRW